MKYNINSISLKESNNQSFVFEEYSIYNYEEGDIKSIVIADATIALVTDFNNAEEKLTKEIVQGQGKKYIPFDLNNFIITDDRVNEIVKELNSVNAKSLNIAGNGIYTLKGAYTQQQIDDYVYELLNRVLNSPKLKNKIELIRSGGQTGTDEAGAKAGKKLGINTIVYMPLSGRFRDANKVTHNSKEESIARFGMTMHDLESQDKEEQLLEQKPESRPEPKSVEYISSDNEKTEKETEEEESNRIAEEKANAENDAIEKCDREIPSEVRADRVNLVADYIRGIFNNMVEEKTQIVQERINKETDPKVRLYYMRLLDKLTTRDLAELTSNGSINLKEVLYNTRKFFAEEAERLTDPDYFISEVAGLDVVLNDEDEENGRKPSYTAAEVKRFVRNRIKAFKQIADNFNVLSMEASSIVSSLLESNITITFDNITAISKSNTIDESSEAGVKNYGDESEASDKEEENTKDGWQTTVREENSFEKLSGRMKKVYADMQLSDAKGKWLCDDLGYAKMANPSEVHNTLMTTLAGSRSVTEMLERIENIAKSTRPYYSYLVNMLDPDSSEFDYEYTNQAYITYNREFMETCIIKNGTENLLIPINNTVGKSAVKTSIRKNLHAGIILGLNPIYKRNSVTNRTELIKKEIDYNSRLLDEAKKLFRYIRDTSSDIKKISVDDFLTKLDDRGNNISSQIEDILRQVLRNAGVDITDDQLTQVMNTGAVNVGNVIDSLELIINNKSINKEKEEREKDSKKELINIFSTGYNDLSSALSNVVTSSARTTFRHDGKQYSSYTPPSYIGKTLELLKRGDLDEYEEEFLKYNWFAIKDKDGKYIVRSPWLKKLYEGDPLSEMRGGRGHEAWYYRDKMKQILLLSSDFGDGNKYYEDLTPGELFKTQFILYDKSPVKGQGFAYYCSPCLSDSYNQIAIQGPALRMRNYGTAQGFRIDIVQQLTGVVISELDRIMTVEKRSKNKNLVPVDKYDGKQGKSFIFFPELNNTSLLKDYKKGKYKNNPEGLALEIQKQLLPIMEARYKDYLDILRNAGVLLKDSKDEKKEYLDVPNTNNSMQNLEEFFYNDTVAQTQIVELFTTDPAMYKSPGDMIKRWKEVATSVTSPNPDAMYKYKDEPLEKVGRDKTSFIVLKDEKGKASNMRALTMILNDKKERNIISEERVKEILEIMGDLNIADGQAIRTLSSYREMVISLGKPWTDEMEEAFRRIMGYGDGEWTEHDFDVVWQTFKPFAYTQIPFNTGVLDKDGNPILAKMPVQLKDSEAVMLYQMITASDGNKYTDNTPLRELINFMEKSRKTGKGVDFAVFESGCKVFSQGAVDIHHRDLTDEEKAEYTAAAVKEGNKDARIDTVDDILEDCVRKLIKVNTAGEEQTLLNGDVLSTLSDNDEIIQNFIDSFNMTAEEIRNKLYSITGFDEEKGVSNEQTVHTIKTADYGVIQETPEHLFDKMQGVGTQILKLMMSDAQQNEIEFMGKKYSSSDIKSIYDRLLAENKIKAFINLAGELSSKSKISAMLQKSILGSTKYSSDLIKGVMLEGGDFAIPAYEAIRTGQLQNICNAYIRSSIINFKTPGGAAIQTSCTYNHELKIRYKTDPVTGKEAIDYVECMMPWYMAKNMEAFKDTDGTIDMNKIDDKLLRVIGYRIPTEDKYSMMPLKIVGILPKCTGSQIILPKEIVGITGSDFDIDKMFLIFQNTVVDTMTERRFVNKELEKEKPEIFKEANKFKRNVNKYWKMAVTNVKKTTKRYDIDFGKKVSVEMNRLIDAHEHNPEEYRNNLKIAYKNRFEYLMKEAKKRAIGNWMVYSEEHKEELKGQSHISPVDYAAKLKYDDNGNFDSSFLKDMTQAERNNFMFDLMYSRMQASDFALKSSDPQGFEPLKRLAKEIRKMLGSKELASISDPANFLTAQQQNIVGKELIAIYASQFAAHAVLQGTGVNVYVGLPIGDSRDSGEALKGKYNPKYELDAILDREGHLISKTLSSLRGAADTAKDPILRDLFQDKATVGIATTMLRLGFTMRDAVMFLANLVVRDAYSRKSLNPYKSFEEVIKNKENEYKVTDEDMDKYVNELIYKKHTLFNSKELEDFVKGKKMSDKESCAILDCLSQFNDISNELRTLDTATKNDTTKSYGPTASDVLIKRIAVKIVTLKAKFIEKANKHKEERDDDLNDKLYSYSGLMFSHIEVPSNFIVDDEKAVNSEADLRKLIYSSPIPYQQAVFTCAYSGYRKLLGDMFLQNINSIIDFVSTIAKQYEIRLNNKFIDSILENLQYYTLTKCKGMIRQNEDGTYMTQEETRDWYINKFPELFEKMKEEKESKNPFVKAISLNVDRFGPCLTIRDYSELVNDEKWELQRGFTALVYENRELATDLFRYVFYRYGLHYNPQGYIGCVTTEVLKSIDGYIDTLRELTTTNNYKNFIGQYIKNNPYCHMTVKIKDSKILNSPKDSNGDLLIDKTTITNYKLNLKSSHLILPFIFMGDWYNKPALYFPIGYIYNENSSKVIYSRQNILNGHEYEYGNNDIKSVFITKNQYRTTRDVVEEIHEFREDVIKAVEDYINNYNDIINSLYS